MQDVKLPPGRYVVAVSGVVDSMSLLDVLRRQTDADLLVAHVDLGIRSDSGEDERLVAHYAMSHNIPYISTRLQLGNVNEDTARQARYEFLRQCSKSFRADAIVLAHHRDDMIETAIINHLRGTSWRGLAPFAVPSDLMRPLQHVSKDQIVAYARRNAVPWREDATNTDESYLRNFVRHTIVPVLHQKSEQWEHSFLQHIRKQQLLRRTIEQELVEAVHNLTATEGGARTMRRHTIIMLPGNVAYELLQQLFRVHIGRSLERRLVVDALLFAKVGRPGKRMPLGADWHLRLTKRQLIVEPTPRVVS